MYFTKEIILKEFEPGYHLITEQIQREISHLNASGILHVFVKHTSAGITINENADPSVRDDFQQFFKRLVPENEAYFTHIYEGSDDMPAHLKASIIGQSISVPVSNGSLNMGTWQGIYLCEFRNRGGQRKLVLSFIGE